MDGNEKKQLGYSKATLKRRLEISKCYEITTSIIKYCDAPIPSFILDQIPPQLFDEISIHVQVVGCVEVPAGQGGLQSGSGAADDASNGLFLVMDNYLVTTPSDK